jgi:hypothetical protein
MHIVYGAQIFRIFLQPVLAWFFVLKLDLVAG